MAYQRGNLKMTYDKDSGRFTLEGHCAPQVNSHTDHQQLLYEALEIAAQSNDKFKDEFKAFCDEYLELTKDWNA